MTRKIYREHLSGVCTVGHQSKGENHPALAGQMASAIHPSIYEAPTTHQDLVQALWVIHVVPTCVELRA